MPRKERYKPVTRTVDYIINEKIKVLREFHIVNTMNEDSIRNMLFIAIRDRPDSDPDVVADRIARSLISRD